MLPIQLNGFVLPRGGALQSSIVHRGKSNCYVQYLIFKRGMKGVYQHCKEKHLHRYLAEFDFRYNTRIKLGFNDAERAELALKGIEGKRLTYRRPHPALV
jgi:hypothetical protein